MKMLKMCLNWKVLVSLAAVGVGVYLFAPGLLAKALPILLLAACPLSMLLMMWSMQGSHSDIHEQQTPHDTYAGLTREEQIARLRRQQGALSDQIRALESDEPSRSAGRQRRAADADSGVP